ncbi:MAG: sulfotransferase domain-containing protein [Candidatus Jettenia sp.]|nr:MAG: sulfotransferase domain-containing protein [Candidatus Jettenia sp.]
MGKKPNVIIAGVTKGGTTSLFSYLSRHPEICSSHIKETCYFLPLRYGNELSPIDEYLRYFKHYKNEKYILEATPGYFYGSKTIPQRIYKELGKVKIIIIFREPVSRLFSFYKASKGIMLIPKEMLFDEYVGLCKDHIEMGKSSPIEKDTLYRGIKEGFYSNYLEDWYAYFGDSLKIVFFEHLKDNPLLFMRELCDWLEIDSHIYPSEQFTVENRSAFYRNKFLHKIGIYTNKKLELLFRKLPGLKPVLRGLYYSVNESSFEEGILPDTRSSLESLYAPHNENLLNMLSKKGYKEMPDWLHGINGR